jgi:hypothetical protein
MDMVKQMYRFALVRSTSILFTLERYMIERYRLCYSTTFPALHFDYCIVISASLSIFCLVLLLSLVLSMAQAQASGLQNEQRPPTQQTPAPYTQPGNQIFLPIIAGGASPLDHDERPPQSSMNVISSANDTDDSDTPPPEGNRHTFVTDSGGHLDRAWFRGDRLTH